MSGFFTPEKTDKWILGGGIGKSMHRGKQAVNLKLVGYGNVAKPKYAANYDIQLTLMFMFQKGK